MSKRAIPAALLLSTFALFCTGALAQALEYKGVPLGATRDEFLGAHRQFQCVPRAGEPNAVNCAAGTGICRAQSRLCSPSEYDASKYAEEVINIANAVFYDNRFERLELYFTPSSYDGISAALKVKYGPPTQTKREPYLTVGGAKSTNDVLLWSRPDGDILIQRYGENLSAGQMFMVSAKWNSDSAVRNAEKAKQRGKSM